MDHTDICKTQIEYKDIDSLIHKKLSKKSKSKKNKIKREKKSHKKKRRSSSSSSSSSESDDQFKWVEKNDGDKISLSTTKDLADCKMPKNNINRDEWMNIETFIPHSSKLNTKLQQSYINEARAEIISNKAGQSDRELNPYWKDGGDGLPKNNPEKSNNSKILDVNWLKKSLRRAEEQALREGKRLEDVAAERWGSLEIIHTMITEAEEMSNGKQNKLYHERLHDDINDEEYTYRIAKRMRKLSRSRSRSRDRAERYDIVSSNYASRHSSELKRSAYRRPKDNDDNDYCRQTVSGGSGVKNWKKKEELKRRHQVSIELPESKEEKVNLTDINTNEGGVDVLTEAEMNKLGARIIKAELMGDEELAAQLKIQLEHARTHVAPRSNNVIQEDSIILMKTDARGITRPIQSRSHNQMENYKKKNIKTHVSGERVRYFIDDDKYSLREMFQREKGRSTHDDETILIKVASKNHMDHMDDIFERQIMQTDSEEKRDKFDCTQAIKEHENLSKSMDSCLWCLDSKNMLKHMVIAVDSAICLSLPVCSSLSIGHCILTPVQHVACQLQLDEDIWDRLKEIKIKLIKMFTEEDLYPIFFEIYKRRCKFSHMQLECIPLPKEIGELAPIYFKKALLECETEWSINKKIVDLTCKGIRHAIPNGLSYFMVEFGSHPGYAHVIEDETIFPQNFAKEIIGGMLNLDHKLWRKAKRQSFEEQRLKVLEFTEKWKKFNSS